jgi:hypothetical protein
MSELIKRHTIQDIYQFKLKYLNQLKAFQELETDITATLKTISDNAYVPFRLDWNYNSYSKDREVQYIDRICWRYLTQMFELHKYMLCTDYDKMSKEIDEFKTPEFNIDNAGGWVAGLKELIYNNVETLIKSVFERITNETYYTGSGYSSRKKKKRNNNGIDKNFIISTDDYNKIFGYGWGWNKPSITDDLEKVCYIMDGKTVPEQIIKLEMKQDKKVEAENAYFKIRVCHNGNTHYTLFDDSRNKLNLFGAGKGIIGEDIKIKIFDKW